MIFRNLSISGLIWPNFDQFHALGGEGGGVGLFCGSLRTLEQKSKMEDKHDIEENFENVHIFPDKARTYFQIPNME